MLPQSFGKRSNSLQVLLPAHNLVTTTTNIEQQPRKDEARRNRSAVHLVGRVPCPHGRGDGIQEPRSRAVGLDRTDQWIETFRY